MPLAVRRFRSPPRRAAPVKVSRLRPRVPTRNSVEFRRSIGSRCPACAGELRRAVFADRDRPAEGDCVATPRPANPRDAGEKSEMPRGSMLADVELELL